MTVLNLLVIALAGLIAYWWASQGAFSSLLHLLCVIAAGAMAFAVWEPVAVRILGMGGISIYAWGLGLLVPFAVFLFIFRLATDKLVPANLNFPPAANYAVGGVFGAASGVLTLGMVLIGAGLMQGERSFMGFAGWSRSSQTQGRPAEVNSLWLPMHAWTSQFYAELSAGSLAPETIAASLKSRQPYVDRMSMGLLRDGALDGRSRISVPPDSMDVLGAVAADSAQIPGSNLPGGVYAVGLTFRQPAFDFGEQFRLSSSQVRLIGDASPRTTAPVAHPVAWTADLPGGGRGIFPFDDTSHYVTSVPGQQQLTTWLIFDQRDLGGAAPRYLQVKGLRVPLATIEPVDVSRLVAKVMGQGDSKPPEFVANLPTVSGSDIRMTNSIAPLQLSTNELPGMRESNAYLTEGRATFPATPGQRINKSLQVKGIFEPDGTRIVRLNISRRKSPIDIWDSKVREEAGDGAGIFLVDEQGRGFAPIGFIWQRRNDREVDITLDPVTGIRKISDFPAMSSAGVDDLDAVFRVSVGSRIKAVRLGEVQIANVDLEVK